MKAKKLAIIGAGFSGLSLAWRLKKLGFDVEVFESKERPGGLIRTEKIPILSERAAHAFLASEGVEELFRELQLPLVKAGHRSKTKWIYRGRPRKWTLTFWETLRALLPLVFQRIRGAHWPGPRETVAQWIERNASVRLKDYLASPALQGIYGTQVEGLSASLILGGMFTHELRPVRGKLRGSLAPREGMEAIIHRLREKLTEKDVAVHLRRTVALEDLESKFDGLILATDAQGAGEWLKHLAPEFSEKLLQIPKVSLTTVTVGYERSSGRVQGFGCLFPLKENFNSLGVLFNTDLFENRGPLESETWIFKGDFQGISDAEILEKIRIDRRRLVNEDFQIQVHEITRWKDTLPFYGLELQDLLESDFFHLQPSDLKVPSLRVVQQGARLGGINFPVYLTGNYLGAIGLTKILSYNDRLAARIDADLRGGA